MSKARSNQEVAEAKLRGFHTTPPKTGPEYHEKLQWEWDVDAVLRRILPSLYDFMRDDSAWDKSVTVRQKGRSLLATAKKSTLETGPVIIFAGGHDLTECLCRLEWALMAGKSWREDQYGKVREVPEL